MQSNKELVEVIRFQWASLFYNIAFVCINDYGLKGESVIRQAVRNFGSECGIRTRQCYDQYQKEFSFTNLNEFIKSGFEKGLPFCLNCCEYKNEEEIIKIHKCKNYDLWNQMEYKNKGEYLRIASIFCEEFHHQMYSKLDPSIQINLCEVLTKGDKSCNFRIIMHQANRQLYILAPFEPEIWDDCKWGSIESTYSLFCLSYYHYAQLIYSNLGEYTLVKGLKKYAASIIDVLLPQLDNKHELYTIENLIKNCTLFIDKRDELEIYEQSDNSKIVKLKRSILFEVMNAHSMSHLAFLYYKIVLTEIIRFFNSNLQIQFERSEESNENLVLFIK